MFYASGSSVLRITSMEWDRGIITGCRYFIAGIGRGQMTVADAHVAHHKRDLYRELLKDMRGITLHENPSGVLIVTIG